MDKEKLYFEKIGDDFGHFMSDYDVARRISLISDLFPEKGKFESGLEVGCGTGRITSFVRKYAEDFTVADISEKLARNVAEKYDVDWTVQDAANMDLPDSEFDLLVSSECIEHTTDPQAALAEFARVTKPGGLVIVTTPNRLWYPLARFTQIIGIRDFKDREIVLWPGQVARALENAGMKVLMKSGCHLLPWQIPGAKKVMPFFDRYGSTLYPLMLNVGVAAVKTSGGE